MAREMTVSREFKEALIQGGISLDTDGPYTLFMEFEKPEYRHNDAKVRYILKDGKGRSIVTSAWYEIAWGDTLTIVDIGKMLNITFTD